MARVDKIELTAFGLVGLVATYLASIEEALVPQRWAHEFWVAKGIVAFGAVAALLMYLTRVWPNVRSVAQRQRYLALIVGVSIVMIASTAQYDSDVPVTGRNVGGFLFAFLCCWAMWTSWRHEPDGPAPNVREMNPPVT